MAQGLVSMLEYLGTRVQWQAFSAVGSVLALFWAINLANRQAADTRRREAAMLKACLVSTSTAFEHITDIWEMFEEFDEDYAGPVHIDLEEAKQKLNRARASNERTVRFLEALDLMKLPTTEAIVVLVELRTAMKQALDQMSALVHQGAPVRAYDYPPAAQRAEELIHRLGDEAATLGARPARDDPLLVHMTLEPVSGLQYRVAIVGHNIQQWRRKVVGLTKAERALEDEIPF